MTANPLTTAMHAAHVTAVWAKCQQRQKVYLAHELEQLFKMPLRAVADALYLLGWTRRREVKRQGHRRRLTTRWYPPGVKPPPIPRGRPRIDLVAILFA